MKQQTAIDWFVQQLEENGIDIGNGIKMAYPIPYDIYKDAKAMEKEQIVEAHGNKTSRHIQQGVDIYLTKTGEQYYNETYGK